LRPTPSGSDAALQRAAGLYQAGRLDEARAIAREIVASDPRHFNALHLLAAIAVRTRAPDDVVEYATRALAIEPGHPEALCNRGIALRALGRIEEALADYDRVLAGNPRHVPALSLKGVALAALDRHEDAIECYAKAIAIDPRYAPAHFNGALSHLARGDFATGWPELEWRWTGSDTQIALRRFAQPQWHGEDIRGKTLLVHAEQGLGDAIQFVRYIPIAAARGAQVVLEAQPALAPLFASLPARVVAMGDPLPPFDFHCPIHSLPLAFGTRLETIPARVPYLAASEERIAKWRARLGERTRPRIGIAWSGSPHHINDRNRSMPLEALDPLRTADRELVSLQKELRESDRDALARAPAIRHFGDDLVDFRDTAALVSLVDVVVSVDTAVAHLAGALARPVRILLPFAADWRWLTGRDDSPWYPTARLVRQPRGGDWLAAVERTLFSLK